jgi:hypothetical protein
MHYSHIDDAKWFPCPDCDASPNEDCWPRSPEDSNWVHQRRVALMDLNRPQFTVVTG